LTKKSKVFFSQQWEDTMSFTESTAKHKEDYTMEMPSSYGAGLSYRHSDTWTIAFDVYRTDWSSFVLEDKAENEINPIDGRLIKEGRLDDTTQVRLGSEYLFIKDRYVFPVRFGLFYDPEPVKDGVDDYYGFSLGAGLSHRKISIDAAYLFRFGRDVDGDISAIEGSSSDIDQHTILVSAIYYF
jgi:long-subunit fatty acid transport protein